MILQRANELMELSERVRAAEAIYSDRQRYSELRDQLAELRRQLFPVWGTAKLFHENGIADAFSDLAATSALRMVQDAAAKFQGNSAALLDQRAFRFSTLRDQVEKLAADAEARLRTAWEQHVEKVVPSIDSELLQTYSLLPEKAHAIAQLREALSRVRRLSLDIPKDTAQLHRFKEAVGDLCRFWDEIADDAVVPPGVAEFLRLARTPSGAPLTSLTNEVIEWLRAKNMLARYMVRTTSVGGGNW